MTPRDFCYWLKGYLDLDIGPTLTALSPVQVAVLKRHLDIVTYDAVFIKTATDETQPP